MTDSKSAPPPDSSIADSSGTTPNSLAPFVETAFAVFEASGMKIFLSDRFDRAVALWSDLQKHARVTIYQHPLWQKAWFETLGAAEGGKVLFIAGCLEEEAILLIPLIVLRKNRIALATFMGGDHANYNLGIFSSRHGEKIKTALPDLLAKLCDHLPYRLDVLDLPRQPLFWDGVENPMAAVLPSIQSPATGGSLALDVDFQKVLARGNAKRKQKTLRAQERALSALGGYSIVRTQTRAENETLYDVFIAQKTRWFAERGIAEKFDDIATTAFFHRLAYYNEYMKNDEKLIEFDYVFSDEEYLSLLAGGLYDGQHFGYFTSMTGKPQYASISPGSLIFYKRIEAACAEKLRRFDFGVGAERYKTSWCDETHILADILLPLTVKGYAYVAARSLRSTIKRLVKQNKTLWSAAKVARRLLAGRKNDVQSSRK